MKSKQLANVLIKILGLYICLGAIPGCVSGILVGLSSLGLLKTDPTGMVMRMVSYSIGYAVEAVVGILIIVKSQKIAEFWFKNEDE
jgi:cytochrome c biogenesis protein CcdA